MIQNLDKIEKIFKLIGSEHDHEALAAVRAIKSILSSQQKNYSDLANHLFNPSPSGPIYSPYYTPPRPKYDEKNTLWRQMCLDLQEVADLTEWEGDFIGDIMIKIVNGGRLSEKQEACLNKIYRGYCG